MTRKILAEPTWHNLKSYRVRLTWVELHCPDQPNLGRWSVYEWELFENGAHIAHGSLPYGENYIVPADVLDQLDYQYNSHFETCGVSDGPSDADPGL